MMKKMIDAYCIRLKDRQIISENELPVYAYGLELLVSGVLNILVILAVSPFLGQWPAAAFFLAGFIPLRLFAGGYHADTHFHCILVFLGIYLVSVFLCTTNVLLLGLFMAAEAALVYLLSPVESPNKEIPPRRRQINRRKSGYIVLFNLVVYGLYAAFFPDSLLGASYLMGSFLAAATLVAGKIKLTLWQKGGIS